MEDRHRSACPSAAFGAARRKSADACCSLVFAASSCWLAASSVTRQEASVIRRHKQNAWTELAAETALRPISRFARRGACAGGRIRARRSAAIARGPAWNSGDASCRPHRRLVSKPADYSRRDRRSTKTPQPLSRVSLRRLRWEHVRSRRVSRRAAASVLPRRESKVGVTRGADAVGSKRSRPVSKGGP